MYKYLFKQDSLYAIFQTDGYIVWMKEGCYFRSYKVIESNFGQSNPFYPEKYCKLIKEPNEIIKEIL